METLINLPHNIISPSKSKSFSKNVPPKLANHTYSNRLSGLRRLPEQISSLDSSPSGLNYATISHLIDSCIDSNSLDLCHKLHNRVRNLMKGPDPFVETRLVSMYAKCGSLYYAFKVFDEMSVRNLYAWSAIIGACSRARRWDDVVELFYWMMAEGDSIPDEFLLPRILRACGNSGDLETGRLIHGLVIKTGMTGDIRVSNSILSVYAKCGMMNVAKRFFESMEVNDRVSWNAMISGYCRENEINEARRLFDLMRLRGIEPNVVTWNALIFRFNQLGKCEIAMELMIEMEKSGIKPDIFTWTSMIMGFSQNNKRLDALNLFKEMLLSGIDLNGVALMSAISVCASLKVVGKGKELHMAAIKSGYGQNVFVGNSLVDMYSKCGKVETARLIFDMISEKDVYTWNSMIGGYCHAGYCGIAHELFKQMQESNVRPNVITWNVMISGYIQNGDEDEALDLFHKMEEKELGVKRDTASWNVLIAGYLHHGRKNKALGIFRQMQFCGVKPNSVTILSILPACANVVTMQMLKEIHCSVLHNNLQSEISVVNSLIGNYAKCGNVSYSKAIFDGMLSTDGITWNTMMTSYVHHGCSGEAIELFERMMREGYTPNRSTLGSIILAYGLAGMVDAGEHVFNTMTDKHQISPCLDHYVAMVNLYGRSGKLEQAFDFVRSITKEPNAPIWSAILTACCRHGNVKFAIQAAEKLLEIEPHNPFVQQLLRQQHNPSKLKKRRTIRDSKEYTGFSWIQDGNTVHTFVSGDLHQFNRKTLDSWIGGINLPTKDSKSKYINIFGIQEEENEAIVGIHSEKLALAFALINSPQPHKTVRIVKNLRMCDHCHRFAKFVSKTEGCEIYISCPAFLHHFKNGKCSCGDYW